MDTWSSALPAPVINPYSDHIVPQSKQFHGAADLLQGGLWALQKHLLRAPSPAAANPPPLLSLAVLTRSRLKAAVSLLHPLLQQLIHILETETQVLKGANGQQAEPFRREAQGNASLCIYLGSPSAPAAQQTALVLSAGPSGPGTPQDLVPTSWQWAQGRSTLSYFPTWPTWMLRFSYHSLWQGFIFLTFSQRIFFPSCSDLVCCVSPSIPFDEFSSMSFTAFLKYSIFSLPKLQSDKHSRTSFSLQKRLPWAAFQPQSGYSSVTF